MNNNLVNFSFITYFTMTFLGAFMKLYHVDYAQIVMAVGIISLVIFIVTTIMEVNRSSKIGGTEKFMWTVGLLMLSFFAGIVYIFSARKRIVEDSRIQN